MIEPLNYRGVHIHGQSMAWYFYTLDLHQNTNGDITYEVSQFNRNTFKSISIEIDRLLDRGHPVTTAGRVVWYDKRNLTIPVDEAMTLARPMSFTVVAEVTIDDPDGDCEDKTPDSQIVLDDVNMVGGDQ